MAHVDASAMSESQSAMPAPAAVEDAGASVAHVEYVDREPASRRCRALARGAPARRGAPALRGLRSLDIAGLPCRRGGSVAAARGHSRRTTFPPRRLPSLATTLISTSRRPDAALAPCDSIHRKLPAAGSGCATASSSNYERRRSGGIPAQRARCADRAAAGRRRILFHRVRTGAACSTPTPSPATAIAAFAVASGGVVVHATRRWSRSRTGSWIRPTSSSRSPAALPVPTLRYPVSEPLLPGGPRAAARVGQFGKHAARLCAGARGARLGSQRTQVPGRRVAAAARRSSTRCATAPAFAAISRIR